MFGKCFVIGNVYLVSNYCVCVCVCVWLVSKNWSNFFIWKSGNWIEDREDFEFHRAKRNDPIDRNRLDYASIPLVETLG